MIHRVDQFLYRKERSLVERVLLFPLYLLSLGYDGIVRARSFLYSHRVFRTRTLPFPVISIGNITVGGTGKTPLVISLAKALIVSGIPVAILSRGYKRIENCGPVVSDGKTVFFTAAQSGDEPFLMANACAGIPVLVGKNRFINGKLAIERLGAKGLLLDDGFQYLSLHRNLNILLVDETTGFGDRHLLPRGILREPLSHLRRTDLFLINQTDDSARVQPLEKEMHEICPGAQIFHSRYEPVDLVDPQGEHQDLGTLKGMKIFALSGVANPHSFASTLRRCGTNIVGEAIFPDHHLYTAKDLSEIENKAKGADGIVTTEKDMVKLKVFHVDRLPIRALRIQVRIREEKEFYRRVMEVFKNSSVFDR